MAKNSSEKFVTETMLQEAVEAILKGMDNLFDRFKDEVSKRFGEVDKRFDKLESEITFIKRDISDIKADLSDTPSRGEFNQLKVRIDKYHPIS